MPVYNYPSPRCPRYKKPACVEDCLLQARMLAKKEHGRAALGPVKKGDKILIVTLPDQDPYVQGAVVQALMEEGAEKVEFISEHELSREKRQALSVADGWREADTLEYGNVDLSGTKFYLDISEPLRSYLNKNPDITGVFYGLGGRNKLKENLQQHRDLFRGCWLFNNWEEFLSRAWTYPDELEIEIEKNYILLRE